LTTGEQVHVGVTERAQEKIERLEHALMVSERKAEVLGNMLKETVKEYESSLDELRIARLTEETLSRSNRDLELFAYVLSHDLQAPLRTIILFLQLLLGRCENGLDRDGRHFIDRSLKAAQSMQQLMEGVLRLARVKTKGQSFASADLNYIVKDVMDNLQSVIQEKGARVSATELPTLMVDVSQIQSLFQNLILNALRYNESPNPVVEIGCRDQDHAYQIFVKDNGIGIPSRFQKEIFTVFHRLHSDRRYPGTGLGLALCKQIVEHHGGIIGVESKPKEGATFHFTLQKDGGFPEGT
jgi:light-regulated signal transduction histidine kinase (bacteriophytochrome)